MNNSKDAPMPNTPSQPEIPAQKKTPLILKILAVLMIISSVITIPILILFTIGMVLVSAEVVNQLGVTTTVIFAVLVIVSIVGGVCGLIFGINLLRNKRRGARRMAEFLIITTILTMLCHMMLSGLSFDLLAYFIRFIILVVIITYIDPTLTEERRLQRKLRDMETRERAEEGTLGLDETGKGFIQLDFFNLFWIFVVACVAGVIIETIYHFMLFGDYQDRAGLLYGPFSPIYGFGAVLMTLALNRFHDRSLLLIFLVSAVIGGAFEYLVSWFLQFAFGIIAWDYSGTFLSIDGRTNGMYMFFWGLLGCVWIKLLLPYMLKLINLIPWNLRYTVTTICAALMIANGGLTLVSLDCWYQREAGEAPDNALEEFCARYYDNDFMENRFQSMTIDPNESTRTN